MHEPQHQPPAVHRASSRFRPPCSSYSRYPCIAVSKRLCIAVAYPARVSKSSGAASSTVPSRESSAPTPRLIDRASLAVIAPNASSSRSVAGGGALRTAVRPRAVAVSVTRRPSPATRPRLTWPARTRRATTTETELCAALVRCERSLIVSLSLPAIWRRRKSCAFVSPVCSSTARAEVCSAATSARMQRNALSLSPLPATASCGTLGPPDSVARGRGFFADLAAIAPGVGAERMRVQARMIHAGVGDVIYHHPTLWVQPRHVPDALRDLVI